MHIIQEWDGSEKNKQYHHTSGPRQGHILIEYDGIKQILKGLKGQILLNYILLDILECTRPYFT